MQKECKECLKKVAVAKKVCECGNVFLKRKDLGFREIPVVLTSKRLRNTGALIPTQLLEENELGFTQSFPTSTIEQTYEKRMIAEKMYPKRERSKTSKYEGFYKGTINKRKDWIDNEIIDRASSTIVAEETVVEEKKCEDIPLVYEIKQTELYCFIGNVLEKANDLTENKQDNKELESNEEKTKLKEEPNNKEKDLIIEKEKADCSNNQNNVELGFVNRPSDAFHEDLDAFNRPLISICTEEERQTPKDSSLIQSPSVVLLRKPDGHFLTENIDAQINIEINNEAKLPVMIDNHDVTTTKPLEIKFSFDMETRKMVVTREFINLNDENNPSIQSSSLVDYQWTDCSSIDQTIKRKRGRPRKHPVVIKVKRPVGRPRKLPSIITIDTNTTEHEENCLSPTMVSISRRPNDEEHDVQVKRSRGRPKGSKDLKPRKSRIEGHERINLFYAQNEMPDEYFQLTPSQLHKQQNRPVFLSPPQLLASAKRQHLRNERLEYVETDRLQRKLDKHKGIYIPEHKREIFTCILDEINRKITNQSFKYHIK